MIRPADVLEPIPYNRVRHKMHTGDILLFSGHGPISSLIRLVTRSRWSHVAMVVRPASTAYEDNIVLCWESTTLSKARDLHTNRPTRGVQLVTLSERLATHEGEIGWRPLDRELSAEQQCTLNAFRAEVRGTPYETGKLELALSALDSMELFGEEDLSTLFCSELVAEAWQRMGLLPEAEEGFDYPPSNEYTPADFARTCVTPDPDNCMDPAVLASLNLCDWIQLLAPAEVRTRTPVQPAPVGGGGPMIGGPWVRLVPRFGGGTADSDDS